jgi:hypothetical protein
MFASLRSLRVSHSYLVFRPASSHYLETFSKNYSANDEEQRWSLYEHTKPAYPPPVHRYFPQDAAWYGSRRRAFCTNWVKIVGK